MESSGQAYYKRRDELYRERKSISKALCRRRPAREGDRLIATGLFPGTYGGLCIVASHLFDLPAPP